MAKVRGTGIAAVNYPTGMNLGGDPSQALIHSSTTGTFIISLASTDLGQGLKTVIAQIAAETLGLPLEYVLVDTGDTDTGPHCMGTFASRATHRVGNAVMMAAREARQAMLEVASEELEVSPEDLETDGQGNIRVKGCGRGTAQARRRLHRQLFHPQPAGAVYPPLSRDYGKPGRDQP